MNRLTVGVMGHVDHGKTALVRALTGMETDRLPEEQRRGISIALGFAHAQVGEAGIDFIDMPGHERFVRTMVHGAGGVEAVLLAVAANEGVKPQTREHVQIAALLGIRRGVVAVTKADLVDGAAAQAAGEAAATLARLAGLRAGPPVSTSTVDGRGLEALRAALAALADEQAPPADQGWPYLPIDRAFVIAGHGTVVTGTLRRGRLAVGDALEVAPAGQAVRVRRLQVHGRTVEAASPGRRVAVNLRGVEVGQVGRGAALAPAGLLAGSPWLTVEVQVTEDAPELQTGARLQLLIGTAEAGVRVRLLEGDRLAPGGSGLAQLHGTEPIAALAGERFILRLPSPVGTVAGGRVLDPHASRLRRRDPGLIAGLRPFVNADPAAILALGLEQAGGRGVPLDRLARLAGLTPERAGVWLKAAGVVRTRTGVVVGVQVLTQAEAAVVETLQPAPGRRLGLAELRAARVEYGTEVLDEAVGRLTAAGRLRAEAGALSLVDAVQDRARALGDAAFTQGIARALQSGGLSPPDLDALGPPRDVHRAVERLVRENLAVRTWDRVQKREIVFHRDAVDAARRTLAPLLASPPGLLLTEAGAALGISRKFSVPLLEHLDAVRVTRRVGDRRVLGPGPAL